MTNPGSRVTKKTTKKKPARKRVAEERPAKAAINSAPADLGKGSTIEVVVSNPHYNGTGTIGDAFEWIWDAGKVLGDPLIQHEAVVNASQQQKEKEIARQRFVTQKSPNDPLADIYWKLRRHGIPVKFDGTTISAVGLTGNEARLFVNVANEAGARGGVAVRHIDGGCNVNVRADHMQALADWNKTKTDAETAPEPITMKAKKCSSLLKYPEEFPPPPNEFDKLRACIASSLRKVGDITTNAPGVHTFESGAVRSTEADGARYDLISPIALRKLAETCREGAIKYNEKGYPPNWLKGMPMSDVMNHLLTHIYKWISGDTSEPHLPHAFWNLMALIHFEETRPDLMDVYPRKTALETKDAEAMPMGCRSEQS
jgi:hypothetical protein